MKLENKSGVDVINRPDSQELSWHADSRLLNASSFQTTATLPSFLILASNCDANCLDSGKVLRISKLLAESGSQSEIIWVNEYPRVEMLNSVQRWGAIRQSLEHLSMLRQVLRQISSFDAVYLTYTSDISFAKTVVPIILMAKFFGKKVVLDYRYYADFPRIYDGGPLQSCLFSACDRVLVLSEFQHHRLERFNFTGGYLPEFLRREDVAPRSIKSIQPKIVVTGPLEKINNTLCVLKAYRLVKQKYPRTELVIAGDGSRRQGLIDLVCRERIAGVDFTPIRSLDDLHLLYESADVYVNCSHLDYLPATMIEAAAHGLPIISTPSVSVLEIFAEGESVLLSRHNDHVSLSDLIIGLIENPAQVEKLSSQAVKRAGEFRWEKVRQHWLSFFSGLNG